MDIQEDKDFAALPEVAKLYHACKERDLTIAEREYLKGARDAWQAAKAQAVPEGFVLVEKPLLSDIHESCVACLEIVSDKSIYKSLLMTIRDEVAPLIEAQEPAND